jgi:hypothetical protein
MAKPNPFAGKKAPPFGAKGGGKPNPFAKKAAGPVASEKPAFFKKGGRAK